MLTSFALACTAGGVNDVVGNITGISNVGVLRRWLFVLREVVQAGTFSERVGIVVVVVVVTSGESNTENHDTVFSVVACSRVVAVVAAL